MLIVFGTRHYGRVDGVCGEYAATRFFHVWYVPLIPLGSTWVTAVSDGHRFGHAIELSSRSILAAYLRVLAPLLAVGLLLAGPLGARLAGGAMLALSAWSWTWRTRRDPRARRRAAWNQRAFGTACDPSIMPRALRARLRVQVHEAYAAVADGRPPTDVARLGATSIPQAVLAHAVLRLVAASERGPVAADARRASERLLDAHRDADLGPGGGPYRDLLSADAPR